MVYPMRHLSIAQIEQYARQELSPAETRRVEAHLKHCPECLERVDVEANSIAALQMMDRMRKAVASKPPRKAE
jgi:anti-sigma factor RsiW